VEGEAWAAAMAEAPTKLRVPKIQTDALLKTNRIQREIKRWIVVLRGRVQVGKGAR